MDKWNEAFAKMAEKADELGIKGVMGIAEVAPDGKIQLQLLEHGKKYDGWGNFYSIACSKLMEMVRTGNPSGTLTPLAGEFEDFVGGTLSGNYYVTFSGAEGNQDLEVAEVGLNVLINDAM